MADDLLFKGVTTLDQLDVLHDEVLARLDDLNQRLEATLAQFGVVRRAPAEPAPAVDRAAS